jgi:hypothetical protein
MKHSWGSHNAVFNSGGKIQKSNKGIQILRDWETPNIVNHYAASITFEDALKRYDQANFNS